MFRIEINELRIVLIGIAIDPCAAMNVYQRLHTPGIQMVDVLMPQRDRQQGFRQAHQRERRNERADRVDRRMAERSPRRRLPEHALEVREAERLRSERLMLDRKMAKKQEAQRKQAQVDVPVRWHFIGGLQSNKAAAVAAYADVVESVDRAKLLRAPPRARATAN